MEAHLHWRSRAHHLVLYDLVITSSIIKRDLLGTFWSMQEYVQWRKSCLQDGRICLRSISWRSPFILKSTGRILLPCSLRKDSPGPGYTTPWNVRAPDSKKDLLQDLIPASKRSWPDSKSSRLTPRDFQLPSATFGVNNIHSMQTNAGYIHSYALLWKTHRFTTS